MGLVGAGAEGESSGERRRLPVPLMLTFGALSGLVAQTATYPLDVVRRRMQVLRLQSRRQPPPSPLTLAPPCAAHNLCCLCACAHCDACAKVCGNGAAGRAIWMLYDRFCLNSNIKYCC